MTGIAKEDQARGVFFTGELGKSELGIKVDYKQKYQIRPFGLLVRKSAQTDGIGCGFQRK